MKAILTICLLPLLLAAATQELFPYSKSSNAGPLELTVEMDRTHGTIDDAMHLSITTKAPADYTVTLPDFNQGDTLKNLLHSQPVHKEPEMQKDGRILRRTLLELEPILVREPFKIGQFTVSFAQAGKSASELTSEEIPLAIEIPEDEKIEERLNAELQNTNPASPMSRLAPPSIKPYLYGSGAILLLVAAICAVIWYMRKRQREKALIPPPPIPPWIIAERALADLRKEQLIETGQFMEFYNRVQSILRTYIEGRFQIHAPERTTEEFLSELRASDSPVTKYRPQLEQFLRHCDLVRFAAHIPEAHELNETLKSCASFINKTKPTMAEELEAGR